MKRPISVLTDQLENNGYLLINPFIVSFSSSMALCLNVKQPGGTVGYHSKTEARLIRGLVVSPINMGRTGMMCSVNGITDNSRC